MKQNFLLALSSIFSTHHFRVNRVVLLTAFLSLISYAGFAAVTVTPASGGTGICANSAQTGSSPAFTAVGAITVTEGLNSDFSTGFNTLTLSMPAGWRFNTGATPSISFAGGGNVVFTSVGTFTASSVTFNIFATGITLPDAITITGLQVQALTPASLPGNIFASTASGIVGITTGAAGTNFGSLSLIPSVTPSVTISGAPSGPICAGTGVTFTPSPVNGGAAPTYNWFVNGGFAGSGSVFSTSTLGNGNTVVAIMTSNAACVAPTTATSNTIVMTVNPVPAAVTVSGAGTFCGSTTITASGGAGGTVYFQGTTSGGTSTATPSTSQVITSSGTYYFRSGTAAGCWGTEGSVTVTINPAATANAGTPQSVCAGGTITLAGSIGGSATSSTWSAPSGTFSNTSSLTSDYTPSIPSGTVTLTLTTNDPDGAGPCAGAVSTVLITVNAIPNPVIVSGAGTFCNSATLTAANGGSGTIFFQGTTSGGTSTVLGGTPQTITTSGTYFFRAQGVGGCWGTEGSAAVTINAGATANAGTPQTVCAGGTITLAGAIGGAATSSTWSAPSGTFSAPGLLTSDYSPSIPSGTVTLTLTTDDPDGGGPCPAATSTVIITVNPLPNAVTVSPAGVFCNSVTLTASGGAGGTIFFQGTTSGGTSTSMGGSPQTVTASGRYFFRSRSAAGCWGAEGGATVTINPLPTAFNVTGGGGYCFGGGGVDVWLSNTESGVNYRLIRDGIPTPTIVAGTFAPISFGVQTVAGVYTVQATNASTGCTNTMTGSVTVSINPLPTLFTVSAFGPASYCSGGAGVLLILSGSTIGVNYQVMLAGSPVGTPVAGTGFFLFLGTFTGAGAHTVIATNTTTGCTRTMTGSVNITVNPLPTAFSVTGGGSYCTGGTGVPVGLAGSSTGVSYQLFRDGTPVGAAVPGTGGVINFGLQTGAGTYTVTATNTSTFCQNTMTGSVIVTINPLPALYTVTGGGSFCTGGTGVSVGLGGSDVGVNYQLFAGATLVGTLPGTGAALDFGLQTVAGTYIVVATDATTLCVRNMTGSVPVNTLPLPTAFTVTGGGSYCTGGPGVDISLSGSTAGVTYELFNLFTSTGITVSGTGGIISFGFQTVAGFYTVVATNTVTGCVNNMTGGVAVALIPLPTAYTVTGGGGYCVGGAGSVVGLSGSDAGVDYQLFNGVTPVGLPVAGTGSAISFGPQTLAGAYTVVATDATTTCVNNMSGFVVVTINLLPNTHAVTGGGIYCAGGTGVSVGLAGSDVGVNYQLFEGVTPMGSPMAGTGAALDFGLQTVAGTYTVVATDAATGCTNTMAGFALVIVNPAPAAYTVIGGGPYCTGGAGVNVGLASSDVGIDYQLFEGATPVGSPMAGTGAALDFGLQTVAGVYTVVGTDASTLCTGTMAGSVTISINPLPNSYTVLGGGLYCVGGSGVDVSLSNSDIGVNYQLMNGASPVGSPVAGTGALISFGFHTTTGIYTVVATDATTGCSVTMSGSATIATNPLPTAYSMTGGGAFCVGGTGVSVGLSGSDLGIAYQLYEGTTTVGTPVTGTGLALDFGLITTPGIYTVQATNTTTTCTNAMSGFSTVSVTAYPVVSAITGSSTVCQGSNTTLANATAGGVWTSGSTGVASVVSSTGVVNGVAPGTATITYTVTNSTGCATSVTTNITVLAAPTVAAISGLSSVCQGLLIHLSNATPGGTWSSDNTAIATISASGNVTGVAPGIVNISYTVTSGSGCSASAVLPITVGNPMPTAALIPAGTATLCGGNPVTLNVLTSDSTGITYSWYLGSVLIPGETNSNYFATSSGIYTARIDNGTCYQEFSGTNVMDPPVATITLDTFAGLLFTGAYSTYQWYMNGTAIPGATNNNVTVGPVGSIFTVVVTDINGCTDTSDAYIIVPLPISVKSVIAANDIRIYPNPATSVLHVDAPTPVYVSVFTADGRVLIDRKEAVSINVSQLVDGMYMIKVYDENNNLLKTDKFIKIQ